MSGTARESPVLVAALDYTARGWRVVDMPSGSKAPVRKGWQDLRLTKEDLPKLFAKGENVGILPGAPSGNLIDVDLDAAEAVAAAPAFLPSTALVSGRPGKPRSHSWYTCDPLPATEKFHDPTARAGDDDRGMLVEIRSTGCQTVAPPSLHPDNERYRWEDFGEPAPIDGRVLRNQVAQLAACALLARHWPAEGSRQDTALALAGSLLRGGWDVEDVEHFIEAVAQAAGDEETSKRVTAGEFTAKRLHTGGRATGWPTLAALVGDQVADRVAAWLGIVLRAADAIPIASQPQWPQDAAPEAFYGLAGDIVRTLEPHTEADPLALLSNVLGLFGNVVGYQPYFVTEQDRHGLRLFTIQVGETAKGRKGVAHEIARRLFLQAAPEWAASNITTGLSSGEGLIWAVRDPIEKQEPIKEKGRVLGYQTVLVDEGIGDKRLMVVEPEFARTLRVMMRDGNILSAVIRQAWDTGNLRVLTKSTPAKATEANISIVGHITKAELLRYLDDSEAFNGFANRFLWVCVRRSKVLPEGGSVNEEEIAALARRVGEAIRFGQGVRQMVRDDDARAIWREVYASLSEGKPGLFGAVIGRAEAQVVRLACIYALLDKSSVVRANHLLAALAFWERCEACARYIFGDRTGDPVADTILAALRAGPLSQTQISHLFRRHQPAGRIATALASLEQAGLVTSEERETGGRPERVWTAT